MTTTEQPIVSPVRSTDQKTTPKPWHVRARMMEYGPVSLDIRHGDRNIGMATIRHDLPAEANAALMAAAPDMEGALRLALDALMEQPKGGVNESWTGHQSRKRAEAKQAIRKALAKAIDGDMERVGA